MIDSSRVSGTNKTNQLFGELPVVVVQSYTEVTAANLAVWYRQVAAVRQHGFYDLERLTMAYWRRRVLMDATKG